MVSISLAYLEGCHGYVTSLNEKRYYGSEDQYNWMAPRSAG